MASSTPTTARRRPKLTQRERDVLALIACGYSTSEIARALWITEETVRTHVKRSLTRLRARTHAHAVAIAFREGLWRREDQDGEGGDDV